MPLHTCSSALPATLSPHPTTSRPIRLAKKVDAGADFVQTQFCFDLPRLRSFMSQIRDMGPDKRVFILVGVGPLRSAKTAE
jgi:methylenetetrahydrofolate reductase (NADPH)